MRRILLLLPISIVLITCSKNPNQTEDRISVSWWLTDRSGSHAKTMDELPVFQAIQERFDIDIRFIHPPSGQQGEKLRKMIASGNLPDILSYDFAREYPGGVQQALNDGVIHPLNDQMEDHAPHLAALLEDSPNLRALITTKDGSITGFPSFQPDPITRRYIGPYVRRDFLEEAHLDPPKTINEWSAMLEIFKNREDVDYPLMFYGGKFRSIHAFIGAYGIAWDFYRTGDEVHYGQYEDRFRDFLELFRLWYESGYIDPGFTHNSMNTYLKRASSKNYGAYVDYISSMSRYAESLRLDYSDIAFVPVPYPSMSSSLPTDIGFQSDIVVGFANAYLTFGSDQTIPAMEILDYGYSPEGSLLYNFGIEGQSWQMTEGSPEFLDDVPLGRYVVSGPYVKRPDAFLQILGSPMQIQALSAWSEVDMDPYRINTLEIDPESCAELAVIMNRINGFSEDWIIRFVTGKTPLSAFDEYRQNLREAGLDRAIQIIEESLL